MLPPINSTWRNLKTGNLYRVMAIATHTETSDRLVVYTRTDPQTPAEGRVLCKPLELWALEMEAQNSNVDVERLNSVLVGICERYAFETES